MDDFNETVEAIEERAAKENECYSQQIVGVGTEKTATRAQYKPLDTKRMVGMAIFAALAYGVTFVFRIPVMFLTFDAKDAVITIASLTYGPVSGIIISLLAALIELITISDTGVYGFIMNFASSAVFSAVAALIYKYKRNTTGAILGFYGATLAMVAVMLGLNTFVTPYYMGVSTADVIALLPTVILPFNVAKALLNSAIAMLLYKPVSSAMKRAGLAKGKPKIGVNRSFYSILVTAVITLALAITIFVILKK